MGFVPLFWIGGALAKGRNQCRFRERTANNLTPEPDQLRSGTVVEEHHKADRKQDRTGTTEITVLPCVSIIDPKERIG